MGVDPISISSGMRNSISVLQALSENIQKTQQRLASGKRVNSALDNPTNYFASVSHLHRANDINSRKDGIAEGIQTIKASENGITSITTMLYTMKAVANQALTATDSKERNDYAETYFNIKNQINTLAADSLYRGTNLLGKDNLTLDFSPTTGDSTMIIKGFDSSADGLGIGNKLTSGTGRVVTRQTASVPFDSSDTYIFYLGDVSQSTITDTMTFSFSNSANGGANPSNIGQVSVKSAVITDGVLTVTTGQAVNATELNINPFPKPATSVATYASVSWGDPNSTYLERTFPTWSYPENVVEVQVAGVKQQGNYKLDNNGIVFNTSSEPAVGQVVTFIKKETWDSSGAVKASLNQIDGAMDILRSKSKALSSTLSVASARLDFNSQMIDLLNQGADNLTLADMNMESANMLMLQTRQNLAITSLSLGSQSHQAVMKLFV